VKHNEALTTLMKSLWLKRLESSFVTFENSIKTQRDFQQGFREYLGEGRLFNSKTFRKILAAETDDEEKISINELLDLLETVDPKQYDVESLGKHISDDFHTMERVLDKIEKIKTAVCQGESHDRKLSAFKEPLQGKMVGRKILIFSYFKDTANYIFNELKNDQSWLDAMRTSDRLPVIKMLTGDTPSHQREERVRRFAPKANYQNKEDYTKLFRQPD